MLFGTLEYVQDDTQFTVLCFIIRGLGAVGAAAFSTAGATYVANMFPDKVSVVMVRGVIVSSKLLSAQHLINSF